MIQAPESLETMRVHLRKPTVDDAPAIFESYARDAEVTRYLLFRPDQTLDDVKKFLERTLAGWENRSTFAWVLVLKDSNALMGMVEVRISGCRADLGYVLARPFWNRGYMSEALQAVTDWAFTQQELFRVWAFCDVNNAASARVLEKIGMEREGILRRWCILPNLGTVARDCLCYSKVR
jgi:[ribosomal protein S5]-alanine N-acetyltransferase